MITMKVELIMKFCCSEGRRASDGLVAQGFPHSMSVLNTASAAPYGSYNHKRNGWHLEHKYHPHLMPLDDMNACQFPNSQFYAMSNRLSLDLHHSHAAAHAYGGYAPPAQLMRTSAGLENFEHYIPDRQAVDIHSVTVLNYLRMEAQRNEATALYNMQSLPLQKPPLQQQLLQHRLLQQKRQLFQKQYALESQLTRQQHQQLLREHAVYKGAPSTPAAVVTPILHADVVPDDFGEPLSMGYNQQMSNYLKTSYIKQQCPVEMTGKCAPILSRHGSESWNALPASAACQLKKSPSKILENGSRVAAAPGHYHVSMKKHSFRVHLKIFPYKPIQKHNATKVPEYKV